MEGGGLAIFPKWALWGCRKRKAEIHRKIAKIGLIGAEGRARNFLKWSLIVGMKMLSFHRGFTEIHMGFHRDFIEASLTGILPKPHRGFIGISSKAHREFTEVSPKPHRGFTGPSSGRLDPRRRSVGICHKHCGKARKSCQVADFLMEDQAYRNPSAFLRKIHISWDTKRTPKI